MTVKQLIAKLNKMPQDLQVFMSDHDHSEYETSSPPKHYFHNYGGKRQRRSVCSNDCVEFMIDNFGARVSKSATKLPSPINYFNHV